LRCERKDHQGCSGGAEDDAPGFFDATINDFARLLHSSSSSSVNLVFYKFDQFHFPRYILLKLDV